MELTWKIKQFLGKGMITADQLVMSEKRSAVARSEQENQVCFVPPLNFVRIRSL